MKPIKKISVLAAATGSVALLWMFSILGCAGSPSDSSQGIVNVRVANFSEVNFLDVDFNGVVNASKLSYGDYSCFQSKSGSAATAVPINLKDSTTGVSIYSNPLGIVFGPTVQNNTYIVYGPETNVKYEVVNLPSGQASNGGYVAVSDLSTHHTQNLTATVKSEKGGALIPLGTLSPTKGIRTLVSTSILPPGLYLVTITDPATKTVMSSGDIDLSAGENFICTYFDNPSTGEFTGGIIQGSEGCFNVGPSGNQAQVDFFNGLAEPSTLAVKVGNVTVAQGDAQGQTTASVDVPTGMQSLVAKSSDGSVSFSQKIAFDDTHRFLLVGVGDFSDGYNVVTQTFGVNQFPTSGHTWVTLVQGINGLTEGQDFYILVNGASITSATPVWKGAAPLTSKMIDLGTGVKTFTIVATEPGTLATKTATSSSTLGEPNTSYVATLISPLSGAAKFLISFEGEGQAQVRA